MNSLMQHDDKDYIQFLGLYNQVNQRKPDPEDVIALHVFLENHPDLMTDSLSMTNLVLDEMINDCIKKESQKILIKESVSTMKREFGYQHVSIIEKMLFDTVLVSWVRLQYLEGCFNQIFKGPVGDKEYELYNKLLTAANRRFTRAVDTLGRLKKFNINFQINIAADGGQQVNFQDNR